MYTKQWTLKAFLRNNPEYGNLLPIKKCLHDKNYIIRTLHDNKKRILELELGYEEDIWRIPKPKTKKSTYKPYRR